jgi:hypothetical protein
MKLHIHEPKFIYKNGSRQIKITKANLNQELSYHLSFLFLAFVGRGLRTLQAGALEILNRCAVHTTEEFGFPIFHNIDPSH